MTVKELAKKLKKMPQDAPTVIYGCQQCMHGVLAVEQGTHKPARGKSILFVRLLLLDGTGL